MIKMACGSRSNIKLSYWLTFCVLLVYQQPAEMTLLLNVGSEKEQPRDPIDPKCSDWEVFDGTDCVCADVASSRCTDQGGMVCDNMGSQYKSTCSYALAMCNEKIPPERTIETCGSCSFLQLVSGEESRVMATFFRTGDNEGTNAEYTSRSNDLLVFYSTELGAWAVGRRNKAFIAMRQVKPSKNPQDSRSGMIVAGQHGDDVIWQVDPFMHFECVQNKAETHRHKRFFFVAFVFVGIAATATTTTLKVVQAKKGCLYYPSVCKLRDRIKKQLKPEVTRLRDRFVSSYGDPGKFKKRVDQIHDRTLDIREKVTTVKELHVQLQLHLSNITVLSSSIRDDFPEFKNALSNYNGWVKSLEKMAAINILVLQLEVMLTLPGLVATSVGSFALAAAGIGAAIAVGFAVADIISSVNEEKKVRDELRDTESKYLKAKSDLESAFANVKQFQKKFCSNVIAFFRELSQNGRTYHNTFQSLYTFISNYYGSSVSDCTTRYSKSNLATLTNLSDRYLQPLINFLAQDIEELRRKIAEVKEAEIFLSEITNMVKSESESPSTIFRAIKASKPKFMSKTFNTLWDLLNFIAKQVLPSAGCYWGYNLADIRSGDMTKHNYYQYSICNSREIQSDVTKLQEGVGNGFAPCKLFRQVKGQVFKSRYSVIEYISEHILGSSGCYWGYDLETIREENSNVKEVDTAMINFALFQTLGYFRVSSISENQIRSARNILCEAHKVCGTTWQTFILCRTWRGHEVVNTLGCGNTGAEKSHVCIPSNQNFETCS